MKKNSKVVSKPRNYVALAMIKSNKHSGVHQKNRKEELLQHSSDEQLDDFYDEYDI